MLMVHQKYLTHHSENSLLITDPRRHTNPWGFAIVLLMFLALESIHGFVA